MRIQALLRAIVIITDGGCVLRFYTEAGACGGYTNAGDLILQAEHLVTRANSISSATSATSYASAAIITGISTRSTAESIGSSSSAM